MNHKAIYSTKAEKYARYRWGYAPEAIDAIFTTLRFRSEPFIADMGAGTGILTRHLLERATHLFAIEPNAEMRGIIARDCADISTCTILDASAEETGLSSNSVDLITAAQAIHWFNPEPTRREFLRILKPGGWLAVLYNIGQEDALSTAIQPLLTPENGVDFSVHNAPSHHTPVSYYFGSQPFERRTFPFVFKQEWEGFSGGLFSASYMPDEDHPRYKALQESVYEIFMRLFPDGWHEVHGETELMIGQPGE